MRHVLARDFDLDGRTRAFRWIEDARRDAAHGLRVLRRSPVFAATAVLSLAIGIGANTAIFTIANALLFRPPMGIVDPDALVSIGSARGDGGLNPVNYAAYLEIVERTTSLTSVFAEEMFPHVMGLVPSGTQTAEPVVGRSVTASFFTALGASSWRGRVFVDTDDTAVVLAYDYWRQRFTGDDAVIGQVLQINGRPATVVGVAAPGFQGTGIRRCDIWMTFGTSRGNGPVLAGGRVRPGIEPAAAAAEVRAIGDAIDRDGGSAVQARRLDALPFSRAGGDRNIVLGFAAVLLALVSLVLVAACANVAGILLTRATARSREMALRTALGAPRGRLVRQLLTETAVLFLCGGLLGIGLARTLMRLAARLLPALPTRIELPLALDWRVLLFALTLSIGAAAVFGIVPAFRGSRVDAGTSLKAGVWSTSGGSRLRSVFVIGQVACAVLLVVLSASFVRILRHAGAADPGFDARGVEVATLDLAVAGQTRQDKAAFWQTMLDRMRQIPAVEVVSLARVPPGGWEGIGLGAVVPGDRTGSQEAFAPAWNIVESGYFSTLRIPLIEGRDFTSNDTAGAPAVVIVSQAVAHRLRPGQSAIGMSLRLPPVNASGGRTEQRLATVIGVVGDIRSSSLIDGLAEPYVYLALAQGEDMGMIGQMSIVARGRGATSLAPLIATVVQQADQRLVLARTESLADAIALGLTPQRVLATISGVMGLVALLLTSMGIYGVTAYAVALRRREFAIRLALGAPRARVVRMVCRQSTLLVAAGLGLGLAVGLGVVHVISAFFYGLPAAHGPTLVGTVVLFGAIGTAASIVPASQAVRGSWRRALHED
ncbi:Macrolide export ATP-binding/permease protein MacB [Luteitalea pratensis]|uniref:Macrolide export ATP-binding/permease protein MacB n=1 Tax=Luteitalea pratensis TaxID=1855912 RepID=A0A143PUZ2_LUTPR|nr:ADOP family duplicated permease [Luteitalea pratensis]AMY12018.1 Macrolide export ATP-binding/permease protein MacB [Luteitalea pratensis]